MLSVLPARSVVCVCDLPYGRTAAKWDKAIPAAPMWRELQRLTAPGRAVVLFGQQPFSSLLVTSQLRAFRCAWVWEKRLVTNGLNAKKAPLRVTEDVLVFSFGPHLYEPQMRPFVNPAKRFKQARTEVNPDTVDGARRGTYLREPNSHRDAYPTNLLPIPALSRHDPERRYKHPTQKPVSLLRYLIRTYSAPGDVILDFACGSGTAGEAALLEGRDFVGIENDTRWFEVTQQRLAEVEQLRAGALHPVMNHRVSAPLFRELV